MNLLKDLIKNFRYVFITTTKKEVYIYLYHTDTDSIGETTNTAIEESYLNYRSDIIASKTEKHTENENEVRLNSMNKDIINYINNSDNDLNKISVINTSKTHKFILEPEVLYAMTKKTKNLSFDMGTISGIRFSGYDYPQLENIDIEECVLFLEKSAVLYVSKFYAKWVKLITFNKVDTPLTLNLFAEKSIKLLSVEQYASVKFLFECKCKDGNEFDNAKFESSYLKLYGQEVIENDKNDERILIKGFNKVYFDNIEVADEVVYSTIVKADRITNFNLGKLTRNISTIVPKPMIILGRVAKVNLRKMTINTLNTATINENDFSIVNFLASDDDFERSITVTDSVIYNDCDKRLKVLKLRKLNLNKVYMSTCTIGDNIDLLDLDSISNIVKLTYNNCNFTSNNDFKVYGSTKVSIIDCTINTSANISLKSPYININGGLWECTDLNCDHESDYMKVLFDKLELHANNFNITNIQDETIQSAFINNCKLDVLKQIKISKLRPSLLNDYIKTEKLSINVDDTSQFSDVVLGFQKNNKCDITLNTNVSGQITVDDVENCIINTDLYIKDPDNIDVNNLDFTLMNTKTNLKFKLNRAFNTIIDNLGDKTPIHVAAYDDINTDIESHIKIIADDDGKYLGRVVNDSEKIVKLEKSIDEEERQVYTVKSVNKEE